MFYQQVLRNLAESCKGALEAARFYAATRPVIYHQTVNVEDSSSHYKTSKLRTHVPDVGRDVPLIAERILHAAATVAVRMVGGFRD